MQGQLSVGLWFGMATLRLRRGVGKGGGRHWDEGVVSNVCPKALGWETQRINEGKGKKRMYIEGRTEEECAELMYVCEMEEKNEGRICVRIIPVSKRAG